MRALVSLVFCVSFVCLSTLPGFSPAPWLFSQLGWRPYSRQVLGLKGRAQNHEAQGLYHWEQRQEGTLSIHSIGFLYGIWTCCVTLPSPSPCKKRLSSKRVDQPARQMQALSSSSWYIALEECIFLHLPCFHSLWCLVDSVYFEYLNNLGGFWGPIVRL